MLKPQPRITELNRPFWDGCNEGRLMIQRCPACAKAIFYPRVCCPFCQHGDLQWVRASGSGRVISHTTVHRTHHGGFDAEAPYVFAAIALDEGPCLYAQLEGAPVDGRSLVGRAVIVDFVPHGPQLRMAAFGWPDALLRYTAVGFRARRFQRRFSMKKQSAVWMAAIACVAAVTAPAALAANVKVTPLGSHDGEFCPQDRALVFEDPTGTRVLYDPGRTVAGPTDPRLGKIDIVLVTHMHGDHAGNVHASAPNAGTCDRPDMSVSAMPNSSAVNIAVAKKSKIVTGSEMQAFFAAKMKASGGNPADSILARFGASRTIGGVTIATVTAVHSNGLDPEYIGGELAKVMKDSGIAAYVGEATGYVLKFSNGLVVYLSGDTGITSDQEKVVRGNYGAKLAVMNIGDGFTTGPNEAAYVMNELVRPNSVIASHANEVGTKGGKVVAGTKTETFMKAVKAPVHVPLSGKTMQFDSGGKCVAGC